MTPFTSTIISEDLSSSSIMASVHDYEGLDPATQTDLDAKVIALSPRTLMDPNRFVCEICNKGFLREQNLRMHNRGHNLPWKLETTKNREKVKSAFVCPEETCARHHPSKALGDLSRIKKHYSRKHGEKNWKCTTCPKAYAVQGDLKAHLKTCGVSEYKCDCGINFTRKDRFINHKETCDEKRATISSQLLLHPYAQNQPQTYPYQFDSQAPFPQTEAYNHQNQFNNIFENPHIPLSTPTFYQEHQGLMPSNFDSIPIPHPAYHFSTTSLFSATTSTLNPTLLVNNMPTTYFPGSLQNDYHLPGTTFGPSGDQLCSSGGIIGGEAFINGKDNRNGDGNVNLDITGLPPLPESLEFPYDQE